MSTFNIDRLLLSDILADIGTGRIQLPDFQRDWRWDDYRIRSLLASVSQAFPIGAVLTLASDGKNFLNSRLIEGVNPADEVESPNMLILDGQQRLTALFQALKSEKGAYTLNTKGKPITRYYYLDMEQCLRDEIDREGAILSCREDRQVQRDRGKTVDLSSPKKEYENAMFPANKIFDSDDWGDEYKDYWQKDPSKRKLFNTFNREVIGPFKQYNLPIIHLRENTPREAVCLIFEKVNTRGVTLTLFELLTASFAIDNFQLRKDWDERFKRLKGYPVLGNLDSTDFLRALTLLSTNANPHISTANCTRRAILGLTVADYKKWADIAEDGFIRAAKFLNNQKIGTTKNVPYQTQLIALAAILADVNSTYESALKADKLKNAVYETLDSGFSPDQVLLTFETLLASANFDMDHTQVEEIATLLEKRQEQEKTTEYESKEELKKAYKAQQDKDQKIPRWYWCGVFGEMYAGAADTQIANDFSEVTAWLREEIDSPSTIREANFQVNRLLEVQSRASAVYKGVYALLISNECRDFLTGDSIDGKMPSDTNIDIHHIFPKDWCKYQGIESNVFNSIINKTALSVSTNRKIGGREPSEYLLSIQQEADIDNVKMDEILASHLISADALRTDDFWNFFKARKEALLNAIEKAMGKKIIREPDLPDLFVDIEAPFNGPDAQH